MATPAQIRANRANAQKSTGPRTPKGKGVVAQNAVKHGLLAREGVLRGEDREEYEEHREALLEELNPTGALEVMLAARIVDLTWRLRRAAQDQNETFGALYDRHTAGLRPGEAGLCPARLSSPKSGEAGAPQPEEPAQRGAILGRMILEDYSGSAVLERLLRCERRIEGSFFRNLHELRRVHDQNRKADQEAASTLARPSRGLRTGWRDEDDQARKERAFAPWHPDEMCQTNPIGSAPRDRGASFARMGHRQDAHATALMDLDGPDTLKGQSCQTNPIGGVSGLVAWEESMCQTPARAQEVGRGRPSYEETPGGVTTSAPADQLCETNPIGPAPDGSQVLGGTAVRSDSAPEGLRKTNPIWSALRGTGIPPASPAHDYPKCLRASLPEPVEGDGCDTHGQACPEVAEWDARDTHGRDAHATEPQGGTPNGGGDESCETNPIPGPDSAGGKPVSKPYKTPRMTNADGEWAYDSLLGRWVPLCAALTEEDLNRADARRNE